jgi:hypothetical protein
VCVCVCLCVSVCFGLLRRTVFESEVDAAGVWMPQHLAAGFVAARLVFETLRNR